MNNHRPVLDFNTAELLISFALFWRRLECRAKGSIGEAIASLLGLPPKDPTEFPFSSDTIPLAILARRESSFRPVDALDV